MSFQGVEFTPEMRKMAVNVKHFFDSIKKTPNDLAMPAGQLTASALYKRINCKSDYGSIQQKG